MRGASASASMEAVGSASKIRGRFASGAREDLDERLGAAGACGRGMRGLAMGICYEQQAATALGGDGEAGRMVRRNPLVFDGGNDGDVSGAGAQGVGALRGDGEGEVVFAAHGPWVSADDGGC